MPERSDEERSLRLRLKRLEERQVVRAVELLADDRAGFWEGWENGGYHMRDGPWAEQRFRSEGERFEGAGR